jgi:hypothetical protein
VRRQKMVSRLAVAIGALGFASLAPVPLTAGPLAPSCAEAASGPSAAIIVDFGDVTGQGDPPGGVVSRCVPVTSGLTGAQALKDAGFTLRFQGGLLCGINGYPANGCGEKTGARKYLYWAYWRADGDTSGWQYSSIGPASARMADGDIDGWRFVEGSGSPNDPQPGAAPDHLAICGPREPAAPSNPGSNAPNGVASSAPGDAVSAPGAPEGAPSAPSSAPSEPTGADAATDVVVDGEATSTSASRANDGDEFVLADATTASESSSAGGIIGVAVVALLIAAFAGAAVVRSKRQPRAQ